MTLDDYLASKYNDLNDRAEHAFACGAAILPSDTAFVLVDRMSGEPSMVDAFQHLYAEGLVVTPATPEREALLRTRVVLTADGGAFAAWLAVPQLLDLLEQTMPLEMAAGVRALVAQGAHAVVIYANQEAGTRGIKIENVGVVGQA